MCIDAHCTSKVFVNGWESRPSISTSMPAILKELLKVLGIDANKIGINVTFVIMVFL